MFLVFCCTWGNLKQKNVTTNNKQLPRDEDQELNMQSLLHSRYRFHKVSLTHWFQFHPLYWFWSRCKQRLRRLQHGKGHASKLGQGMIQSSHQGLDWRLSQVTLASNRDWDCLKSWGWDIDSVSHLLLHWPVRWPNWETFIKYLKSQNLTTVVSKPFCKYNASVA